MPYRRGEVIAVPYEYSDLSGGKMRPVAKRAVLNRYQGQDPR